MLPGPTPHPALLRPSELPSSSGFPVHYRCRVSFAYLLGSWCGILVLFKAFGCKLKSLEARWTRRSPCRPSVLLIEPGALAMGARLARERHLAGADAP